MGCVLFDCLLTNCLVACNAPIKSSRVATRNHSRNALMQLTRPGCLQRGQLALRPSQAQKQGLLSRTACCQRRSRQALSVQAIAEAERTGTSSRAMTPIQKEVTAKLRYLLGKSKDYDTHDIYQGTAWSVREHLIDSFENTHDYWE